MFHPTLTLILPTALFVIAPFAAGEIVEVLITPVADTGLYEISPTNNLGAVTEIPAGVHSSGKRSRCLVRFRPEEVVPIGARMLSAELRLGVTTANPGAVDYGLHRLLRAWTEGTKGGANGEAATAGETTWLARSHPDDVWAAPGGLEGLDYETDASASAVFSGGHTNISFDSPALTADVQRWLDNPGTNFGWMLQAVNESAAQSVRRIASRESGTNAPRLILRYRIGPMLRVDSFSSGTLTLAFDAEANHTYAVESRASWDGGDWETRTNYPRQTAPGVLIFGEAVDGASRFYRVREP